MNATIRTTAQRVISCQAGQGVSQGAERSRAASCAVVPLFCSALMQVRNARTAFLGSTYHECEARRQVTRFVAGFDTSCGSLSTLVSGLMALMSN
jgi:hypothetical protein